ncbi:MAG: phosphodiester glycosidase family protein [Rhizobiaceae bacterium]|nr:phosphodiester glycosidase family protein [Rhizobiaceae bacterium]
MKRTISLLLVALALAAAAWWMLRMRPETQMAASELPPPCADRQFEGLDFVVCAVDLSRDTMRLALDGSDGRPLQRLDRLPGPFALAMNAGMYHSDFSPVGLYVEDGRELSPLNTADGAGNFFMKPNGVFFIDEEGQPGVLETGAYAAASIHPRFATQSGPMLVVDGDLHARFEPDGSSRYIRNGVGVDEAGRVVLAISREPVSLGRFGRLFRDALGCRNALFFDGGISALYDGSRYIVGGDQPAGPMLVVAPREQAR